MKDSFELLTEKGLIFPGSLIAGKVIEEVTGVLISTKDYQFKMMSLRDRIQLDGYFVTEKGCAEGALQILHSKDMAAHGFKLLKKSQRANERVALIMKAHDISSLSETEKEQHKLIQAKAARCAIAVNNELLKD